MCVGGGGGVCVWAQIYYLMEMCVHITPHSGDMIPYGDIIQCSIREKTKKQCVRMLKLNTHYIPHVSRRQYKSY